MNKRNFNNKRGHALVLAVLTLSLMTLSGCDFDFGESDSWANLINEKSYPVQINGNTLTYGDHVYTLEGAYDYEADDFKTPTATLTFTNIPSGYTEFEAVYENFLGKTPEGVAAMVPMVMEIFARDAELGEECLDLICNSSATVAGIVRILKTKYNYSEYSPEDDQYIQRFLPAALLKGATYSNAYAPDEPFVVELCASPNGTQESPMYNSTVYYGYILTSGGWDSFQRAVTVSRVYDSELYQLQECSSCYTQCRPIRGTWQGLK